MSTSFDRAHPTTSIARGVPLARGAKVRSVASVMGARMVRNRGVLFLGGVVAFASIEMAVLNHVASSNTDDKTVPLATSRVETPAVAAPAVVAPAIVAPAVVAHPIAAHAVVTHPVVAHRAVERQLASRPVVAPLSFRPLDDAGDGSGLGSFAYAGTWEHVRGIADGRSEGTSTRSYRPGATATLRFAGRQVKLLGITGPTGGRAIVQVDGHVGPALNFYAATKHVDVVVYASPVLARGDHTLSVEIVPADVAAPKQKFVNIDGALAAP